MKKTVTYNGEKIKVEFEANHISRDLDTEKEKANTWIFKINGKDFIVTGKSIRNNKWSSKYYYNGVSFPDNHRKVIEYILNN